MGSTETTLYIIAIYTSVVGIKKTRFVLACALIADLVRNAYLCRLLSFFVIVFFLTFCHIWRIIILMINFKLIFINKQFYYSKILLTNLIIYAI